MTTQGSSNLKFDTLKIKVVLTLLLCLGFVPILLGLWPHPMKPPEEMTGPEWQAFCNGLPDSFPAPCRPYYRWQYEHQNPTSDRFSGAITLCALIIAINFFDLPKQIYQTIIRKTPITTQHIGLVIMVALLGFIIHIAIQYNQAVRLYNNIYEECPCWCPPSQLEAPKANFSCIFGQIPSVYEQQMYRGWVLTLWNTTMRACNLTDFLEGYDGTTTIQ